jgi:hypothetical protein
MRRRVPVAPRWRVGRAANGVTWACAKSDLLDRPLPAPGPRSPRGSPPMNSPSGVAWRRGGRASTHASSPASSPSRTHSVAHRPIQPPGPRGRAQSRWWHSPGPRVQRGRRATTPSGQSPSGPPGRAPGRGASGASPPSRERVPPGPPRATLRGRGAGRSSGRRGGGVVEEGGGLNTTPVPPGPAPRVGV